MSRTLKSFGDSSSGKIVPLSHYKEAGVDTEEADAGLSRLTSRITRTWPSPNAPMGAVKLEIGQFANVVDIGGMGVAISTDGVGSKAMIADKLRRYDTIGIDCVAMNVNDIICVGAKPVSMVDYVAIEEVNADVLDAISVGLCKGAETAGISIVGGETAQLPGMVHGFDLAGTAIGYVSLDKILVGKNIRDGDALIGVESNGIHSNGLTLARKSLLERGNFTLSKHFDEFGTDLGTELLRPTHIYVREAMELIEKISSLKALVHITSDGFLNLTRLNPRVSFVIDDLPPIPPIFTIIQKTGGVSDEEMFCVFNMGIGFCAVVGQKDVAAAMSVFAKGGFKSHLIGHAVADTARTVTIPKFGLRGHGKQFRR
jgi:phosphoribosylformylglycinamidine cyclo-ligase